jgi:cation transport regulator ChaB
MNFNELSTYNLADAVKFHNRLNPGLWNSDETLRPEVRDKLLEIASDFQEFLGVSDLEVEDITISGSNAAYSYTPHSDIDLHLVVRKPESHDEVYQELFNAKKYQYNDEHDIRIRGADVELYVQDVQQPHHSAGIYSILNNEWVIEHKQSEPKIDKKKILNKGEEFSKLIDELNDRASKGEDVMKQVNTLKDKIKKFRQCGLEKGGEYSYENLTFKLLRRNGYIERLMSIKSKVRNKKLSLPQ